MIGYNPMLPGGGYAEMGATGMGGGLYGGPGTGATNLPAGWKPLDPSDPAIRADTGTKPFLPAGLRLGIASAMPGMAGGPGTPGNPIPSAMPGWAGSSGAAPAPGGVVNFGNTNANNTFTQNRQWVNDQLAKGGFDPFYRTDMMNTAVTPGGGLGYSGPGGTIAPTEGPITYLADVTNPSYGVSRPGSPSAPRDWTPSPQNFESNYGYAAGNPQQAALDQSIKDEATKWLTESALPSIRSTYVGTGGLGGSRQGVAQSGAIGQAHQNLTNALAQSRYGQYNQDQSRNLSRYQGDQGFYSQNRGLDLDQQRIGLAAYGLGDQSDWTGLQNANGIFSPWGSKGGTTTSNTSSGGGWPGILGGLMAGGSFGRSMGWFGS